MPLLTTSQLSVHYTGVPALDRLSMKIESGTLVGLIGPNGAGKTTTIDALTGLARSSGTIEFDGHRIDKEPPHARAALGMVRTFQSVELFEDLSVMDNLRVAAEVESAWAVLRDLFGARLRSQTKAAEEALEALDLSDCAHLMPGELSHGHRKLIGVARALAAKPKLVLLDEPAAGLDSSESRAFAHRLRKLVERGITALVIEHDIDLVFDVCDYVYVIEFGKLIAEGTPDAIRRDQKVIDAYLGGEVAAADEDVVPVTIEELAVPATGEEAG